MCHYNLTIKEFEADFYFRQIWRDERLAFSAPERMNEIVAGHEVADQIWQPDTFIANQKSIVQDHETNMKPSAFIRIERNGQIYYSRRYGFCIQCSKSPSKNRQTVF